MPKYDSYTKFRNLKRAWQICPRCNEKAVSKDNKKCMACKHRLFWLPGDDCGITDAIKRMDGFFVWYKPAGMLEGWYDLSFFNVSYSKPT